MTTDSTETSGTHQRLVRHFRRLVVCPVKAVGSVEIRRDEVAENWMPEFQLVQHGGTFRLDGGAGGRVSLSANDASYIIDRAGLTPVTSAAFKRVIIWQSNTSSTGPEARR